MTFVNELDEEGFLTPEQLAKRYFGKVQQPATTVPVVLRPESRNGSFRNFTRRLLPGEGYRKREEIKSKE